MSVSEQKAVIVLGMHRSGTSAVMGALSNLGIPAGERLLGAAADNPKGFWEHIDIVAAHEQLLSDLRSSWDDIRPLPTDWLETKAAQHCKKKLKKVLADSFKHETTFAIKDPRMCRLMPLWNEVFSELSIEPCYLITYRPEVEVSASLVKRDKMNVEKSAALWALHYSEIEQGTRGKARYLICYSDLLKDPQCVLEEALNHLEVSTTPPDSGIQFVDDKLQNHVAQSSSRSDVACSELLKRLEVKLLKSKPALIELPDRLVDEISNLYLTDARATSAHMADLIGRNSKENSSLLAMVQENKEWANSLEKELAGVRDELIERNCLFTVLEDKHHTLKEANSKLAVKYKEEVEEASDRLDKLIHRNSELEAEINALTEHSNELTTQIHELWNSHSWRITKGLRYLSRKSIGPREVLLTKSKVIALKCYRSKAMSSIIPLIPLKIKNQARIWLQKGQEKPALFGGVAGQTGTRVSIIIPVYNHAEHIEQCVLSALSQTYTDCEVIVVEDCSPDPRVKCILETLAAKHEFNLIFQTKNTGISEAQNTAIKAATGDIIAFLDCDDYLTPNAIETCMKYWQSDAVYMHTGRVNVDVEGEEINRICFGHLPRLDYFEENLDAFYATHFKLMAKHAFSKVGLFESRFDAAQDYDMALRVAFHYPREQIVYIPEFLYHHRLHANQTTEIASDSQNLAIEKIKKENRLKAEIRGGNFDKFVSFIMLSFGKEEQSLEAIESLRKTVNIPHEIILFDNGSSEETVAFIEQKIEDKFENLRVFYNDTNLGPAAGRREALKKAKGDYFIIFDNDEIAEPGWLEELLVRAQSEENVGAVCCKVVFPDGRLQFTGGKVEPLDDELIDLALYHRDESVYNVATSEFLECDWCPIGATLFTVNPLEYLHEGYPNVFEDAGVSFALKRKGYKLLNCPSAWVWHHHITFQPVKASHEQYMKDRYNPQKMLLSIASFYKENGLLIQDEYIWRENKLADLSRDELKEKLLKL